MRGSGDGHAGLHHLSFEPAELPHRASVRPSRSPGLWQAVESGRNKVARAVARSRVRVVERRITHRTASFVVVDECDGQTTAAVRPSPLSAAPMTNGPPRRRTAQDTHTGGASTNGSGSADAKTRSNWREMGSIPPPHQRVLARPGRANPLQAITASESRESSGCWPCRNQDFLSTVAVNFFFEAATTPRPRDLRPSKELDFFRLQGN